MTNKKVLIFFVILFLLFSISSVSAIDENQLNNENNEIIYEINEFRSNNGNTRSSITNFTDLNFAIDNAESGDIINLDSNVIKKQEEQETFKDGIFIDKNLTINGNNHIIDANYSGRIFSVSSDKVLTLNNIVFKNGNHDDKGGAIYSYGNLTIKGSANFNNHYSYHDGGVIYSGGIIIFDGNFSFNNNNASGRGSTIYSYRGININGNIDFSDNYVLNLDGAGTIFCDKGIKVNGNVKFINNYGVGSDVGGGAISSFSTVIIDGNIDFINNTGGNGGGAISSHNLYINGYANFINNTASGHGGAIYCGHNLNLNGTVNFYNNSARGEGGAIYSWLGSNISGNVNFINNSATESGGALSCWYDLYLQGNFNFINNSAKSSGAINGEYKIVSFCNANFIGNFANYGNGGAVTAKEGLYVYGNLNFIGNSANGSGGALFIKNNFYQTSNISNSNFINNSVNGSGGAIFNTGSRVNITDNVSFIGNSANGSGGAIFTRLEYEFILGNDIIFADNNAKKMGDAIFIAETDGYCEYFKINNTTFLNNKEGMNNFIYVNTTNYKTNYITNSVFKSGGNGLIYLNKGLLFLDNNEMVYDKYAIYINKGNISSKVYLTYDNQTYYYPDSVILKAILKDDNGNVIFDNNGIIFADDLENSLNGSFDLNTFKYIANYYPSNPRNYIISGNPNFLDNYTVYKGKLINLNDNKYTFLTSENITMYFRNGTKYLVTLRDFRANPISNQKLIININGANYTRFTDENGVASMNINLRVGNYSVNVKFSGSNEYHPSETSNTIKVLSTISGKDIVKICRNGTHYYANFTDGKGNPLKNTEVIFNINGVFYNRKTNDMGVARLKINLDPREYIITAYNLINNQSYSNKITVLSTMFAKDVVKYFRNGTHYYVKVIDSQGKPAINKKITFNINGVFYERISDNNGIAKLSINLDPRKYIITAIDSEIGLNIANNITVLPRLSGSNVDMKYKDGTQYKVKLVDNTGNPMVAKNIKMNINGVFYERVTDMKGIAKLNINLDPKSYIITASYENLVASNTIVVKP